MAPKEDVLPPGWEDLDRYDFSLGMALSLSLLPLSFFLSRFPLPSGSILFQHALSHCGAST